MGTRYAIERKGTDVGGAERVYCYDMSHLAPGCWSSSRYPEDATTFPTREEAERAAQGKAWQDVRIVEVLR